MEYDEEHVKSVTHRYLCDIGLEKEYVGRNAFIECVWEGVRLDSVAKNICTIYRNVSKKLNKSLGTIESGIRFWLARHIDETVLQKLNKVFDCNLTIYLRVGDILSLICEKIKKINMPYLVAQDQTDESKRIYL